MKKILLLALLAISGHAYRVDAQIPFNTCDSADVNNIRTGVTVHGDMFCDPGHFGYISGHCYYPAGDKKLINLIGALWMSGYDAGGQLHTAAQTYRQDGNDYWPGPLDAADTLTYATSYKWAKIWKLSQSDIQSFLLMPAHNESNTPAAILTWPGKGNTYARGNGGYALSVTNDMAPFADMNGNGIYEPLAGEYPMIKGDQALWWVFSDNGPAHSQSNGLPLGVEVQAMVYGYKRGTAIDNVLYYEYKVVNRSPNTYSNFRLAVWDDVQLGNYDDDFIGFDSTHRMGITYNGTDTDGYTAFNANDGYYGGNPPVTGLSMVVLPGDGGSTVVPAGCFNMYYNDASTIGNPVAPADYNNYMRSRKRNGAHITNSFNGPGAPCGALDSGPDCDYMYPGDPADATQWSECKCNDHPGDRHFILSSNDVTLPPGGTQQVVLALMVSDRHAGGCGSVSFTGIKELADTAWSIYHAPLPPLPLAVQDVHNSKVTIFPNPATGVLHIENDAAAGEDPLITIYNALGQRMNLVAERKGSEYSIDISHLATGVYHIQYTSANSSYATTFVKE